MVAKAIRELGKAHQTSLPLLKRNTAMREGAPMRPCFMTRMLPKCILPAYVAALHDQNVTRNPQPQTLNAPASPMRPCFMTRMLPSTLTPPSPPMQPCFMTRMLPGWRSAWRSLTQTLNWNPKP